MKEIEQILPQVKDEIFCWKEKNPNGVVMIWGVTATGKSKLSILLAKEKDFPQTEIISADSRQIFKHMDIGTDKISQDIRNEISHHQIDFVDPKDRYTAGQWQKNTKEIIKMIHQQNKLPMIVGGTGLYIDTIYKNFSMPNIPPDYELRKILEEKEIKEPGILHQELLAHDPVEAGKIHPKSTRYLIRALEIYYKSGKKKTDLYISQPPENPLLMIGLRREKEDSIQRIQNRAHDMIENGLIQEVERLLKQGYHKNLQSMQGIGYKQTVDYLEGKINKTELEKDIQIATNQLAKRQRTRFRRYINESTENPRKKVTYKIRQLS